MVPVTTTYRTLVHMFRDVLQTIVTTVVPMATVLTMESVRGTVAKLVIRYVDDKIISDSLLSVESLINKRIEKQKLNLVSCGFAMPSIFFIRIKL